jgi:hypothetical protein
MLSGDMQAVDEHFKGVLKMVEIRGGLDELGLNGILATLIQW